VEIREGREILHNEELSDFCTPSNVKVVKDETERTCSMHGRHETCVTKFYWN
jgi:hypothetical protein